MWNMEELLLNLNKKWLCYPKIYFGHIDNFAFEIQNSECTEITGKFGSKIFKELFFRSAQWNIAFGILSEICYHYPVFISVVINKKNIKVDNNIRDESCKGIYEKSVQGTNQGPEKGEYNDNSLIASYNDQNKGSLLYQYSMFNLY